jgi:hypothetical protein
MTNRDEIDAAEHICFVVLDGKAHRFSDGFQSGDVKDAIYLVLQNKSICY